MDGEEFIQALNDLEKEKGIDKDILFDAIDQALISAYKRNFGTAQNVKVNIDRITGGIKVYAVKKVVQQVEDPYLEINLEDATDIDKSYKVDDTVNIEVTPRKFGRIAAQTAKQVIVQRIREAERGIIFEEYLEKENEIMDATIQRIERRNIFVEIGRTEALLMPTEQMKGEQYRINDHIKVYVLEVKKTSKGPQILVSRTHPGLVKRLFELEVPEIQSGIVLIKSIAREAGYRTKMAVYSDDKSIDPVGSCVGQKGIRVEKIVEELKGEKIDVVKWSQDPVEFIGNALSPAKVIMVQINEKEKAAKVIVPDNQLSLAIGKEGQNARLAAKLTGWKIDIKSQTQSQESIESQL